MDAEQQAAPTSPVLEVEAFECSTREGSRLSIWRTVDPAVEQIASVVLVPGFGRRMRHMAAPALYLARNGFTVYRGDLTHHVGLSEETIWDFTLTRGLESVEALVNTALEREGVSEIGVAAASLSARFAIRLASEDERVSGVLGLVGVVDTQRTLSRVFGEDYSLRTEENFFEYAEFEKKRIHGPPFWYDWHGAGWVGIEGTIEELGRINRPIANICGSDDDWVSLEEVQRAFEAAPAGPRHLVELPHAEHELSSNPVAAQTMLEELTRYALLLFGGASEAPSLCTPDFDELAEQIVYERRAEAEQLQATNDQGGQNEVRSFSDDRPAT